ncbi:coiled-coil domain-containing protein 174 [Xylocopa sonorina]|uniref:coiled-coil domain-containing protein 174 n=1 Tax=Xylocopa sonorina TaxID=1818115 RepID=UPI00403B2D76
MNNSKKINVNISSLVGLKAELLKKQHEVNEAKLKSEATHNVPKLQKKKPKKLKSENKSENSKRSEEYIEDINTHKKSKLMLEAKARLYEQLIKSKTTNENFLVDFTNKSDESENESLLKDEDIDASLENEDDWVEYEDCFGRTRKCLREDLPLMQKKDQLIKQQIINKKGIDPKTKDNVDQYYIEEEKEPEIEIMRRKWEEQTKKLADKANIHYQDVLFDEARAHGVGYYAFSQDEEERIKQQENLFNLRKETERKQSEIKELKELREKMEHNRLKAARIRQRVRAGLPIDTLDEEFKVENNDKCSENTVANAEESSIVVKEDENKKEESTGKDEELEKENKIKALGELLGKRTHWYEMSQEEWVDKCRKIRVDEFGPVYENFKSAGFLNSEDTDTALYTQNNERLDLDNKVNIPNNTENINETNIDSYDIPLPPTLIISNTNVEHNFVEEIDHQSACNQTIHSVQQENNTMQTEMKPNRNIDEASIAAGLRYLREKFEKSQNS